MTLDQSTRIEGRDGRADFDFLMGTWTVRNRRLRRPHDWTTWEEFEGTAVARPIWGGLANIDEIEADTSNGRLRGMTLRLYDPRARQWSLYWANGAVGVLERPVVGEFRDGRGEFYNQDVIEGRAVLVRYLWSGITDTSCRWEQSFSWDGGESWTVDWVMEFTRRQPPTADRAG